MLINFKVLNTINGGLKRAFIGEVCQTFTSDVLRKTLLPAATISVCVCISKNKKYYKFLKRYEFQKKHLFCEQILNHTTNFKGFIILNRVIVAKQFLEN